MLNGMGVWMTDDSLPIIWKMKLWGPSLGLQGSDNKVKFDEKAVFPQVCPLSQPTGAHSPLGEHTLARSTLIRRAVATRPVPSLEPY